MDQKYEETDLKLKKPIHNMRFLKFFEKSGNGSKIWGNGPFEETYQQNEIFKVYKIGETDQKHEETDLKFSETVQKYEETDQF